MHLLHQQAAKRPDEPAQLRSLVRAFGATPIRKVQCT